MKDTLLDSPDRTAEQWKDEVYVWVDKFELYAKYHAYTNQDAKDFVDATLAKAKQMKDAGMQLYQLIKPCLLCCHCMPTRKWYSSLASAPCMHAPMDCKNLTRILQWFSVPQSCTHSSVVNHFSTSRSRIISCFLHLLIASRHSFQAISPGEFAYVFFLSLNSQYPSPGQPIQRVHES